MANTPRNLMDDQQAKSTEFLHIFENFKKLGKDRRTSEKIIDFESQRVELWEALTGNHELLLQISDPKPPQAYFERYEKIKKINEEFIAKIQLFLNENSQRSSLRTEQEMASDIQQRNGLEQYDLAIGGNSRLEHSPIIAHSSAASSVARQLFQTNIQPIGSNTFPLTTTTSTYTLPSRPNTSAFLSDQSNNQSSINYAQDYRLPSHVDHSNFVRETPQFNNIVGGHLHDVNSRSGRNDFVINPQLDKKPVCEGDMLQMMSMLLNQTRSDDMRLQPYDGNFKDYHGFKELYDTALASRPQWTEVGKYMFLLRNLKGEALEAVNTLGVSQDSHREAWRILREQFDNRRAMLAECMDKITDPTFCLTFKDPDSIKKFAHTYKSVRANFNQLKTTLDECLMLYFMSKMDPKSLTRMEDFVGVIKDVPSFEQLDLFIEKEKRLLPKKSTPVTTPGKNHSQKSSSKTKAFFTGQKDSQKKTYCHICSTPGHRTIDCPTFLSSQNRSELLRKHKLCVCCGSHKYRSSSPCRVKNLSLCSLCTKPGHLSILHPLNQEETEQSSNVLVTHSQNICTLLPTAIVKIVAPSGELHSVRCLIDLCAERSYICESLVQTLRFKRTKTNIQIRGIDSLTGRASSQVNVQIRTGNKSLPSLDISALVVPKITGHIPTVPLPKEFLKNGYQLADNGSEGFIGILLGGDVASRLFLNNVPNQFTSNGLLLQPTIFGWIVSGNIKPREKSSIFVTQSEDWFKIPDDLLHRIETLFDPPCSYIENSDENDYCERLFAEKHYREKDGRYVVPTPWKEDPDKLGHSYRKAVKIYINQRQKWNKNQSLQKKCKDFMEEYRDLGHMTKIEETDTNCDSSSVYYIPYLCILKTKALTSKLRIVFNASMPTSTGVSLNDIMCEGPKLQTHIFDVLQRMRTFNFMFSADITKMFRQIKVLPEDTDKLRIIWGSNPSNKMEEYRLNTVTYGTDAAPYLAIRTIHQCADDNATDPKLAQIIKQSFYVDDLLYGADTIEEAHELVKHIDSTMMAGQFPLTKWLSNDQKVLADIPWDKNIMSYLETNEEEVKILGIPYKFRQDTFTFKFECPLVKTFTKRAVASVASSFYDPIGFILPFIMMLRMILQQTWQTKIDWSEQVSKDIELKIIKAVKAVNLLNEIQIPRHISCDSDNIIEMIGFSDASNVAQAAVIYNRVRGPNGYVSNFVAAKGNVIKIKTPAVIASKECTIPKSELQALLTLVELFAKLKSIFAHRNISFRAFTDSQIVLAWVRNSKQENKIVERLVKKIKKHITPDQLHYVKSEENPADPASRGLTAEQLAGCDLWFKGPSWLTDEELPNTPYSPKTKIMTTTSTELVEDIFSKYSSWILLIRIISRCLSWRRNTHHSASEQFSRAKLALIKYYQNLYLSDVINCLKNKQTLNKHHWLASLSPFLDSSNIIRVGGRLRNATHIPLTQKHPIVIPKSHILELLVDYTHKANGHASHALLMRTLNTEYWIPGIRYAIKKCIHKCTVCIRWRATNIQPMMAQLPKERVTPSNTFEQIGIDLCGPFTIKASALKFDRTIKVWILTIVCMATKATHLELLTSLTSEAFLAAFTRFCSRRGTSKLVWSDNGTNFVGANKIIRESWKEMIKKVEERTAVQEVEWKFIPTYSPTFGGLWEASVRSLKYFIKRMEDVRNLTYEEFNTLLCRIEALLNSRPLCQNNANDEILALTPFHFINQRGMTSNPVDAANKVPLTKKWLMIHKIQEEFWMKFQTECLNELQRKRKWLTPQPNLKVQDVVIIKEFCKIPGDWKLGRITRVYPDPEGTVRQAEVQTPNKIKKNYAVQNLVPLLTDAVSTVESQPQSIQEETPKTKNNVTVSNSTKTDLVPSIRVRPNRQKKIPQRFSIIHLCLLALMVFIPNTAASKPSIVPLGPGVHVEKLGEAYQKVYDKPFVFTTNSNFTFDMTFLDISLGHYIEECNRYKNAFKTVHDHCHKLLGDLTSMANGVKGYLKSEYNFRTKRDIPNEFINRDFLNKYEKQPELYPLQLIKETFMFAKVQEFFDDPENENVELSTDQLITMISTIDSSIIYLGTIFDSRLDDTVIPNRVKRSYKGIHELVDLVKTISPNDTVNLRFAAKIANDFAIISLLDYLRINLVRSAEKEEFRTKRGIEYSNIPVHAIIKEFLMKKMDLDKPTPHEIPELVTLFLTKRIAKYLKDQGKQMSDLTQSQKTNLKILIDYTSVEFEQTIIFNLYKTMAKKTRNSRSILDFMGDDEVTHYANEDEKLLHRIVKMIGVLINQECLSELAYHIMTYKSEKREKRYAILAALKYAHPVVYRAASPLVDAAAKYILPATLAVTFSQSLKNQEYILPHHLSAGKPLSAELDTQNRYSDSHKLSASEAASQLISDINTKYTLRLSDQHIYKREKRNIVATIFTSPITRAIVKYGFPALTTAQVVVTEVQLQRLKADHAVTQSNLIKTLNLLSQQSAELNSDNIQARFDQISSEQMEKKLMTTIIDFAYQISLQYETIKLRHFDLTGKGMFTQLQTYVDQLALNDPHITIPDIGEDIFSLSSPSKGIASNGMITLTYMIPIVNKRKFTTYALMSVPDNQGNILSLSNNKYFQKIAIEPLNASFVDITDLEYSNQVIDERLLFTPIDNCTLSAVLGSNTLNTCQHNRDTCDHFDVLKKLDDFRIFSMQGCDLKTKVICSSETESVSSIAAIITPNGCGVASEHGQIWLSLNSNRNKRDVSTQFIVSPIQWETRNSNVHPGTSKYAKAFEELAKSMSNELDKTNSFDYQALIVYILAGITALILLSILIKYLFNYITRKRNFNSTDRWFVEWTGEPSSSERR